MKKIILACCFCVFLICLCLTAAGCREESARVPTEPEPLATPTRLWMQDESQRLVWDGVTHADAYLVMYGDTETEITENQFTLPDMDASSTFTMQVKAVSYTAAYTDSDWATYTYEPPTPGLAYTISDDARGYLVSRGNADLNGRIVIPDSYRDLPVIEIVIEGFAIIDSFGGAHPNIWTTEVRFPTLLEEIGQRAFTMCVSLTELSFPPNLTKIPYQCFFNCKSLQKVTLPDSVTEIDTAAFMACSSLTDIHLSENLTEIGGSAFENCALLTGISLPGRVTTIERRAFYNCSSLREVIFPEATTCIGDDAFHSCTSLGSFTLPSHLTYLDGNAFHNTLWYENCQEGFVIVRGDILYCYKGTLPQDTVLDDLPAEICQIAARAFFEQKNLVSITLPDRISFIGDRVFAYCTSLTSICLPAELTEIPAQFLYKCESLTEVVLPETVTAIRKLAFAGCSSLTKIILPEHITTIENLAFMNCSSLTRVQLPDSVSFLQDTIFLRCSSLRAVCFPAGITEIPNYFFQSNENLAEVVIPKSITKIGEEAFFNCTALSRVYYLGTQTDWASVTFGASNESIENAVVFYYSETEPPLTTDGTAYAGNYWHYAPDGVTPTVWEKES